MRCGAAAAYRTRYRESIRLPFPESRIGGAISALGSHLLSFACLLLYGRYISDTLSAVRAVRAGDVLGIEAPLVHKRANQYLLARLLRRKAEILEVPVQFFPISPERVKRTSVFEGLQSLGTLVAGRLRTPEMPRAAEDRTDAQAVAAEKRRTNPVASR